ncbi:PTS sugar transporter subunit IIA [Agromyces luteolus]|uniref:Phosphocarrier protein HPr n=1 Tax=Agromyces luteolus TaxID=88373 RepID=A0A7C9HIZ5_9MICO|nr:dihydroxyacetone kinase phosphoryl donor subunit DhaM [Agromyces luteolus]MUN08163.1 HPr family phosphocarrier protein [Agromyces luteolus]GLK27606.1 PTS sugar transporter subunit IIA [Agromyces luteolus]
MADGGRIGIVVVSHSEQLAAGVVELAHQMAPNVRIEPAGGTDDGRIGTSFELVTAAIGAADAGTGVVVLCDLGSAILTAETAMDFLDEDQRERVRIADAPLVEGAVAASVAAESGDPLETVVRAAESAGGGGAAPGAPAGGLGEGPADVGTSGRISRRITLTNSDGLHARPAAELVKLASTFSQRVTVNGIDAKSLLAIMALGLVKGDEVEIATDDAAGAGAVDAIADLASSGFGEH